VSNIGELESLLQVSGEYPMIKIAVAAGMLDEKEPISKLTPKFQSPFGE
jgi:delta-aminolevulinic acid dehydratase/porphobilinogen synthase